MTAFLLVSVLSAAPVLTVPALPSKLVDSEIPCRLGRQTFTLKLTSEFGPTGSSSVENVTQSVRLDDWFEWERTRFEDEPLAERVRFECDGQRMRVLFDSGRFIDWVADTRTHSLVPTAALGEELEGLWAAKSAETSARVAELSWFFAPLSGAPEQTRIGLLAAREALNRDDLARAEKLLSDAPDVPWKAELSAALAARREHAPYRFVDGAKIGSAWWNSGLLEPGEVREYFWQGARFCVVQRDGSKTMRCFDPQTKKWSERSPAIEAPFIAHIANSARFEACNRAKNRCVSCYSFFDALPDGSWLGVDGGRLWLAREPLDGARLETLSEERAGVLQSRGFGGALFGGARFVLKTTPALDDFVAMPVAKPGNTWHPLPAAPRGWEWRNILVSPDQQLVAAFALPRGASAADRQGEWWLFRIAENR